MPILAAFLSLGALGSKRGMQAKVWGDRNVQLVLEISGEYRSHSHWFARPRTHALMLTDRRMFHQQERAMTACVATAVLALTTLVAHAQTPSGEAIKIGYCISQTGGLAPEADPRCSPRRSGKKMSMPMADCSVGRSSSSTTMIRATPRWFTK
jgi:hypothetical protein